MAGPVTTGRTAAVTVVLALAAMMPLADQALGVGPRP